MLAFEDATMPCARVLLGFPLLVALAGCYRAIEPGVAVSGRVTYLGKPVENASIAFTPDIDKPGRGGQSLIINGWYSIPSGEGLTPGDFNILITTLNPPPNSPDKPTGPTIPERYAKMGTLPVTIPAQKKSYSFDIDLKPDPSPGTIETPGGVD